MRPEQHQLQSETLGNSEIKMHSNDEDTTLTIAIPTFNRASKLDGLLQRLTDSILHHSLQSRVKVLVSDNASTDNTSAVVEKHRNSHEFILYECNKSNLGFDGNVFASFERSKSTYTWFFSDDDIPDQDAVKRVLDALVNTKTDVLRMSFRQPPTAIKGAFDFEARVHCITDPKSCIEIVFRWPKISTYVIRNQRFDAIVNDYHRSTVGDGYSFILLALSALQSSDSCKVAIISDPIASCDIDFDRLDWTPSPFLNSYRQAEHPFVATHSPELKSQLRRRGYYGAIGLAFVAKSGKYRVSDPKAYDKFIKEFPIRPRYLLASPRSLLKLILLKLNFVPERRPST